MTTKQIDGILARIGPTLREAREEIGMSQIEVNEAAGLAANVLCRYESGHSIPRPDTLYRVLDVLTLDYIDFFERILDPSPGLVVPTYSEPAPDIQAAVMAAIDGFLKRARCTRSDFTRLHRAPNRQQWAQYENNGMPGLSTIMHICIGLRIGWLDFWADVQGRLDGGRP